jgi:hypothetical protein
VSGAPMRRQVWIRAALLGVAVAGAVLVLREEGANGGGRTLAADRAVELRCGEVAGCTDSCGSRCSGISKVACLYSCKDSCRDKGCASARRVFDALTSCIYRRCFFSCVGGPSPGCSKCTRSECAVENRRCQSHGC